MFRKVLFFLVLVSITVFYSLTRSTVPDTNARANVTIKLKDRAGAIAKKWEIPEAWVSEYNTGDLDAQGNNVLIEKITLQHQGFRGWSHRKTFRR